MSRNPRFLCGQEGPTSPMDVTGKLWPGPLPQGRVVYCDHSFRDYHDWEISHSGKEKARKMRGRNNFPATHIFRPAPSGPLSLGEAGTSARPQWVSLSL